MKKHTKKKQKNNEAVDLDNTEHVRVSGDRQNKDRRATL